MIKKFLSIGMLLFIIFSLCACDLGYYSCNNPCKNDGEFETDCVMVVIKEEYFKKFEAKEFTIEDFKWDNVEEIRYEEWYNTSTSRWMMVYLKHHGEKDVLNAIDHFRTLDFVKTAEPNYYVCTTETYCQIL